MTPYFQDAHTTLYCADCRDVLSTLEPGSVDLVLTDPPYGHNNNNNGDLIHRWEAALGRLPCGANPPLARAIPNDGEEANELARWLFAESARILAPGCCCCCCCCGGGPDPQFARWALWLDEALEFKQMVVWDKGPMGMGWHYRRSYETVLVAQKKGAACRWFDDTNRVENIIRHIPKIIPQANEHPTVKPDSLMTCFIRWHTEKGNLVVDPFCGSGTTLVAAKLMGRKAIGCEIIEKYCETTARRLEQGVLEYVAEDA